MALSLAIAGNLYGLLCAKVTFTQKLFRTVLHNIWILNFEMPYEAATSLNKLVLPYNKRNRVTFLGTKMSVFFLNEV